MMRCRRETRQCKDYPKALPCDLILIEELVLDPTNLLTFDDALS